MILVCNVKIQMKCVHTFRTGRHKRQTDITLLFQYIKSHTKTKRKKNPGARTYAVFAIQRQLEPLFTGTSIAAFGIDAVMYTAAIFVETFIFI